MIGRYDTEGCGTISGDKMMQKLGVSTKPSSSPAANGRLSNIEENPPASPGKRGSQS